MNRKMLKKTIIVLISALVLSSCQTEPLDPGLTPAGGTSGGSGSGSGNVDTTLIVGDWLYTDFETDTTTTTVVMGNTVTLTASTSFISSDAVFTFNADGTYSILGDLTFEIINQGVSQGNQSQAIDDSGTYTVTGNELELVSSVPGNSSPFDDTATLTISTLDATDLVIDLDSMSSQNAGGATVDITIDGFAEFERQ